MSNTELPAGRELDALIAERVMGWERRSESWYDEEGVEGTRFISPDGVEVTAFGWGAACRYEELDDTLPHYSTDIAAAFAVVDALRKRGFGFVVVEDTITAVQIKPIDGPIHGQLWYRAPERALAICRAALAAIDNP